MNSSLIIIIYVVVFGVMIYTMTSGNKKEKKRRAELMNSLAVGDYVLTNAGMYGQIIDITTDMVIVEFGSKNCRIPMLKTAINSVEKPEALTKGQLSEDAKNNSGEV